MYGKNFLTPFQPQKMVAESCWLSYYRVALRADTRGEPHQLNPLNDEDTWEFFLKKLHLLDNKQVQFSNVLALSYNDLPFHLRPCFLYLRLFPKDYDILVRRLLCLWLAEGFVKQTPRMTLEDTVEIYLEELVKRSMIQISKWRKDGSPKTCCMLGVLHNDSKFGCPILNFKPSLFYSCYICFCLKMCFSNGKRKGG